MRLTSPQELSFREPRVLTGLAALLGWVIGSYGSMIPMADTNCPAFTHSAFGVDATEGELSAIRRVR